MPTTTGQRGNIPPQPSNRSLNNESPMYQGSSMIMVRNIPESMKAIRSQSMPMAFQQIGTHALHRRRFRRIANMYAELRLTQIGSNVQASEHLMAALTNKISLQRDQERAVAYTHFSSWRLRLWKAIEKPGMSRLSRMWVMFMVATV
uniref:Uncharacterized protein n=1 Tax=Spongospora subterranea TaxID=70186 RepID=A0A0H5QI41_9EUKA|eukprot:CRZ01658.1 hypothetical protein [Spongospora subterranea]